MYMHMLWKIYRVVTLADDTKTLCATLFSPDAENIIGFTAAQLKEAEDKNTPLTAEIETKIHKMCNYPIIKLYTEEEMTLPDVAVVAPSNDNGIGASQCVAKVPNKAENQLSFIPRTKKVVEGIGQPSSCKRALDFAQTLVEESEVVSLETYKTISTVEDTASQNVVLLESPIKKNKNKAMGKEKEC